MVFEDTSSTLLSQARCQDPEAWAELVQTYSRPVYRWSRRAGLQPADASNVVQEVLRAVARKLPEFHRDSTQGSFRGWLRTITQNKIHDHWRTIRRQADPARGGTDAHAWLMQLAGEGEFVSTVNALPSGRMSGRIHTAIDQVREHCSARDWLFFWRIVVDGQSAVDVGEEFGVTGNAVRIAKMRVLRKLRAAFEDAGTDSPPRTS